MLRFRSAPTPCRMAVAEGRAAGSRQEIYQAENRCTHGPRRTNRFTHSTCVHLAATECRSLHKVTCLLISGVGVPANARLKAPEDPKVSRSQLCHLKALTDGRVGGFSWARLTGPPSCSRSSRATPSDQRLAFCRASVDSMLVCRVTIMLEVWQPWC